MMKNKAQHGVYPMAETLKESFYRTVMQNADPAERARDMVLAASNNELWKIRILHEEYAVDVRSLDSEALNVAAQLGHLETVKYLVAEGCDINRGCNSDGFTPYTASYPFILALQGARWDVAEWMLEQGADPCANNNQPLLLAVEKDCFNFIRILFETGKLDNIRNGGMILDHVARYGTCETARFLLSRIAHQENDESLNRALLTATTRNAPQLMLLFLESGANPDSWQGGCLNHSAIAGNAEAARILINHGADAAKADFRAFRGAVLNDQREIVRLMLELGCLYNHPDVFQTLPKGGKFGSPLETANIVREWEPANDNNREAYLRAMYRDFLKRDFPAFRAPDDFGMQNGDGRSLLVALILAGEFESAVSPFFSKVTTEQLLLRDNYGINAVEAFSKYGELDKLFSPALWLGRCDDLRRLWRGLPEYHQQEVDIEKTITAVHQHELKELRRKRGNFRLH